MSEQREILFRGKRWDNGKWCYGDLFNEPHGVVVIHHLVEPDKTKRCRFAVIPETVGQYTGLKDNNGTRIFEGDIVHVHDTLVKCTVPHHEFDGIVSFADGSFCVVANEYIGYRWMDYDVTVIGNIHEDQELLEAEDGY